MDSSNNDSSLPGVSDSSQRPSPPPASPPPPPIPVYMPPPVGEQGRPRKSFLSRSIRGFFILLLIGSLILNMYLSIIVFGGVQQRVYQSGDREQKIVLIDIQDQISMESAEKLRRMLGRAADDEMVKGVILVINSPGGYVVPSEMMNMYIQDFKQKTQKKLYASVQQVGASGAYWAAAAADRIYAQTNSAVGSIGVISIFMVLEKTLKEKLGIEPIVIKSSRAEFKDKGSPFRMPTVDEKQKIIRDIDKIHARFVEAISRDRSISTDDTWKLANGDVYDGPEALEKKLIDKVGFLDDAIADLTISLNLIDPMVVRFVKPPTIRDILTAQSAELKNPFDIQWQLQKLAATPKIQALYMGR